MVSLVVDRVDLANAEPCMRPSMANNEQCRTQSNRYRLKPQRGNALRTNVVSHLREENHQLNLPRAVKAAQRARAGAGERKGAKGKA